VLLYTGLYVERLVKPTRHRGKNGRRREGKKVDSYGLDLITEAY
jgi:hypothetical protein